MKAQTAVDLHGQEIRQLEFWDQLGREVGVLRFVQFKNQAFGKCRSSLDKRLQAVFKNLLGVHGRAIQQLRCQPAIKAKYFKSLLHP